MARSQYTDLYLLYNTHRLESRQLPVTPGTYLQRVLRGRAKSYIGKYEAALYRALESYATAGKAVPVISSGGRQAYISAEDVATYNLLTEVYGVRYSGV